MAHASRARRLHTKYLIVLAGSGLGGLVRYLAGTWIMLRYGGRFPLGTLLVNISGSFFIGLAAILLTERLNLHVNWRLFLVVGVLGGYTTFSSFEYESLQLVRDGARWMGILYVAGSVFLGYAAVWLGAALAARR
jgi:CrcB protein